MSNVIIDPRLQGILKDYKTVATEPIKTTVVQAPSQGRGKAEEESTSSSARGSSAEVVFDGTDITKDISPYLLSVSYTDNEEDETDDLQISLQDRDQIWLSKWLQEAVDAALKPRAGEAKTEEGRITAATVNAKSGLILRAGKSKQTKRLNAAPFGTRIEVTDPTGDWWAVNYGGQSGYMWYSYLTPIPPGQSGSEASGEAGADGSSDGGAGAVPRGFPIQARIHRSNWGASGDEALECGEFELDSVDCSGPPSVINIKASSLPFSAPIRQTKKTKAWEAYELQGIGAEIAANAGMSFSFLSDNNPTLAREEQTEESDIEFLSRLTHNYGLSLKCTNNCVVIFDQMTYEKLPSVMTITKGDGTYLKYKLSTGQANTKYTSARVSYTTPDGQLIEGIVKTAELIEKEAKDAESGKKKSDEAKAKYDVQRLEIHQKVESIGEAKALAEKLLRNHNKFSKTATFNFHGEPKLVAGATIALKGFGPWDGKYIISQAKHTINSSGYTTQINLRNVLEAY